MTRVSLSTFSLRRGRTYLLIVLAMACLGWGLYSLVEFMRPAELKRVRLGAGSAVARRFQIAQCLADEGLA